MSRASRPPLVLMYHGIDTVPAVEDPDNMFVPPAAFAAQLELLLRRGYHPMTEMEYLGWFHGTSKPPARSVLITFDDGYVSVLRHAAPILRRLQVPAVCYLSCGHLGGPAQWAGSSPAHRIMGVGEVSELAGLGVAIASHGMDHHSLPSLSPGQCARQLHGSRAIIEDLTGVAPATYAYPFGHHSPPARRAVRSAGYELAFATYDGDGRWAIPRVDVNATDTPRTFALKTTRGYPAARSAVSRLPRVRGLVHRALGRAGRP